MKKFDLSIVGLCLSFMRVEICCTLRFVHDYYCTYNTGNLISESMFFRLPYEIPPCPQVRTPSHQNQASPNLLGSLRMARCGAINQGVFTSGSLTTDRRAQVDAFVDRWHCRLIARRSEYILTMVLEHLAQSVRYEEAMLQNRVLEIIPPKKARRSKYVQHHCSMIIPMRARISSM